MKPKFKFSNEPYYRSDIFRGQYGCYSPSDAERELTATLSEAISKEIDRQVLEFLKKYNYETKV